MPVFLFRLLRAVVRLRNWAPPAAVVTFVFLTSWLLMVLAEPPDAELADPANYWWWFIVTASTVGYGDLYPVSAGGRLVAGYVIIGGIATLTTLFAQLAAAIDRAKGRRMKGSAAVGASDHVVVLGYAPGRTERIIDELLADDGRRRVVLCAWEDVETHPMPEVGIDFVRGDLADEAVLRRAGVDRARSALIDARDDNEALVLAVAVDHVARDAHLVVALRDMSRATHLNYVDSAVRCVQWHNPRMITEELQDPGISQVYAELMTHGGSNTYSVRLPDSFGPVSFGECQTALGERYDATVLAARVGDGLMVSPPWQTRLAGGTVLYYVCRQRIGPDDFTRALDAGSRAPRS